MKRYTYLLYYYSEHDEEWLFTMSVIEDEKAKIPSRFVDEIIKITNIGLEFKIEVELTYEMKVKQAPRNEARKGKQTNEEYIKYLETRFEEKK